MRHPGSTKVALQAASWRGHRTFSGTSLQTVAFPLGGIGTGTVSLGGRGNLCDWEIFNRPAKGKTLPYTFFAIWARPQGHAPVARVLERRLLPPFVDGRGLPPSEMAGLPRLAEARFTGEYPFARIAFEDDTLPVQAFLEAFNPMVPLDEEASGLPVAIFLWRLRNPSDRPVETTVALSLCNAVGYDGQAELGNRPGGPLFGANLNRWLDEGTVRGLCMTGEKASPNAPGAGSLAVATSWPETTFLEHWERAGWFDSLQRFWDDFRDDGRLPDQAVGEPTPDGLTDVGTLGLRATLPPGGEVTLPVVLGWHFPNLTNYWNRNSSVFGARLGNWYTSRYADAWEVVRQTIPNLQNLHTRTRDFHSALFGSTLPPYVLDAVSSQMSIIRTTTCLRTEDGAFHAFEGCNDTAGCCPMDCTHVWNYEQSLAHLYPALERSMRQTDFMVNTRSTGRMSFRTLLPVVSGELWEYKPAADGQMGCILKLYREWQLSGDTEWLRRLWPQARRAIEWAWEPGSWDADRDGVMEGEQHNTYDIEFFGPNTMTGTLYLGALEAAARLAEVLGDDGTATRCREVYESGRQKYDAQLWNGEYYEQRAHVAEVKPDAMSSDGWHPSPVKAGEAEPRYQYGPGCLSDQLLGQWFCHVVDLGYALPSEHVREALLAVVRHNWRQGLEAHESCQRTYALNDETGLLLCSWPRGGRPAYPFPYADEVWTGIEYQVAAHCIYEGMVDEGLAIVRAVRERHDGARRNPWDEFECGHHYARAMASWSVLLALSGYHYSAPQGRLRFAPKFRPQDFRCFFTTGTGWGMYRQRRRTGSPTSTFTLDVHGGDLSLRHLEVPDPSHVSSPTLTVSIRLPQDSRLGPRDSRLTPGMRHTDGVLQVDFGRDIIIPAGARLAVQLRPGRS